MVNEAQNSNAEVVDRETEQAVMPLPYIASYGERLSDGSECRVIDCEQGSVAEMMCPKDAEDATVEFIVRAVNAHDALVAALRFTDNGHGHFAGCVRTTPAHPSRPCRNSCEFARGALALVDRPADESAKRPISDDQQHGTASEQADLDQSK